MQLLGRPEAVLLCILLAALILVRHRDNIRRLQDWDGTQDRQEILSRDGKPRPRTAEYCPTLAIVWPSSADIFSPI
jgi:hypothetical protein